MSQNILDSMTEEQIVRAAMRLIGSKTSAKKARSSRKNGKLAWSKKRKAQLDRIRRKAINEVYAAKSHPKIIQNKSGLSNG